MVMVPAGLFLLEGPKMSFLGVFIGILAVYGVEFLVGSWFSSVRPPIYPVVVAPVGLLFLGGVQPLLVSFIGILAVYGVEFFLAFLGKDVSSNVPRTLAASGWTSIFTKNVMKDVGPREKMVLRWTAVGVTTYGVHKGLSPVVPQKDFEESWIIHPDGRKEYKRTPMWSTTNSKSFGSTKILGKR